MTVLLWPMASVPALLRPFVRPTAIPASASLAVPALIAHRVAKPVPMQPHAPNASLISLGMLQAVNANVPEGAIYMTILPAYLVVLHLHISPTTPVAPQAMPIVTRAV